MRSTNENTKQLKVPISSYVATGTISTTGLRLATELVTPTYATALLAKNIQNRPISRDTVNRYAAQMKAGLWKFNGDPIRIASGGELLDGQHRLQAVVQSGVAQEMVVIRGIHRTAFDTIDLGRKRGAADILAIAGVGGNRHVIAAVARTMLAYESGALHKDADISSQLQARPTEAQVLQWVRANEGLLVEVSNLVSGKYKPGASLSTPSSLAAVALLMYRSEPARTMSNAFLDAFSGRIPCWGPTDPRHVAREYFIKMKTQKTRRAHAYLSLAILIKAANAHFADRSIQRISWSPSREWFPKFGDNTVEACVDE